MSLLIAWSPFFQSRVRMRGRTDQLGQRVRREPPHNGELARATVRDNQDYIVVIRQDNHNAVAECNCPNFAQGAYCKHIWATLLDLQHNPDGPGISADELAELNVRPPKAKKRDETNMPNRKSEPEWIRRLCMLRPATFEFDDGHIDNSALTLQKQIGYVVLPRLSTRHNGLVIELRQRIVGSSGWGKFKLFKLCRENLDTLTDPIDRKLCALLLGATWISDEDTSHTLRSERSHATYRIASGARRSLLKDMIETGRCYIDLDEESSSGNEVPLYWENDQPWNLWLVGREKKQQLVVNIELRRNDTYMDIGKPDLILGGSDGIVISRNKVSPFNDHDAFRWVGLFRNEYDIDGSSKPMNIPLSHVNQFINRLYMLPHLPEIELPQAFNRVEKLVEPVPHMDIYSTTNIENIDTQLTPPRNHLIAKPWFAYESYRITPGRPGRYIPLIPENTQEIIGNYDNEYHAHDTGKLADTDNHADYPHVENSHSQKHAIRLKRHHAFEQEAINTLFTLGCKSPPATAGGFLFIPTHALPAVITALIQAGWQITADRQAVRTSGNPRITMTSGIDWFEMRGDISFQHTDGSETIVPLPDILAAARAGKNMITLDDGSHGLLPETWLNEHGLLASLGEQRKDHIRFRKTQAALINTLIRDHELDNADETFLQLRKQLDEFNGIKPLDPSPVFNGKLRNYQRDGLGWMAFLCRFGMGGILADDMGLGKTIQVLAMLQARRRHDDVAAETHRPEYPATRKEQPSLIVAPRSVIFNWVDEAKRFTPDLKVMAYTGNERSGMRNQFDQYQIIVTSYGLLRRDITELQNVNFDYVVLDEAQAVKNAASQSAKACRLLHAEHRLALTGTPIENHIGDLWSIFEFLNPGVLGTGNRFNELVQNTAAGRLDHDISQNHTVRIIADTLKPFILRRTKQQVLTDLPEKTEQTILCEMDDRQRQIYEQLRTHYRGSLLKQIGGNGTRGLGKAAFRVLEALLRLRQAACHPGLINDDYREVPATKLDALEGMLNDIISENAKALVFSQFTSLLSLLRNRLDQLGIRYVYLDGQTYHRKQVVQQFQNDPDIPLFLISLKAGGLGLNLTAAEYVFILDPWWNPAVEAQAIDRTHRIGQNKPVFAYRLICENTVEQRILELQDRKRRLADAIVGGDQNLLKQLTREDLERLLT